MAPAIPTIEIGSIRDFGLGAIEALSSTFYPSGHNARRPEYLSWLYEENPCGQGEVVGARENGLLIGMMGLIPLRVQIGREIAVVRMVVNVLTHPEHRNKNLFVRMIRVAREHCVRKEEWLIGHPNRAAYPGWKRTGMVFRAGYELKWIPPVWSNRNPEGELLWVVADNELQSMDFSALAAFQETLGLPTVAADGAFLNWRFLRHPTCAYRVGILHSARRVLGYCVRRKYRPLVDLVVDWQGEEYWRSGPPSSAFRISLLPWPRSETGGRVAQPSRVWSLPGVEKNYRFFATPPQASESAALGWEYLTFAATDFA